MKILYAASEVAPFVKTGGLGDVAGSLPQALAAAGHEVAVVCPLYSKIEDKWRKKMKLVQKLYVQLAWRSQYCGILRLRQKGVTYYFIDNEYYFARKMVYGEYDDAERFAFFSKAVLEMLPELDFQPDIINCNDWQTALIPVYYSINYAYRPWYEKIKTVYTIHNIQYQGQFGRDIVSYVFGIDDYHFDNGFLEQDGCVNLMKAAILCAHRVTTVSETYAEEIQTPAYGYRLDSILRWNRGKLYGIINGLDTKAFDPLKDKSQFVNFSVRSLERKKMNRAGLLELCGLDANADTPVIGMVTRFADQKGLDLVAAVLEDILRLDLRLIVLGTGDPAYEWMFRDAMGRHPDKLHAHIGFDAKLANQIYGGSDLFLMPSMFEPCGLAQMISMRYGTLPIVRETGGLKDTVFPYNQYTGEGNGFSFTYYNAHDMLHVIEEAVHLFKTNKQAWKAMQVEGMTTDFSWAASAQKYIEVYEGVINE